MKILMAILGMLAIVGMGMAEDFLQGEAKGAEAPGAMMIGGNQSPELEGLFVGEPVQLSGVGADIFDTAFFQMDGWAFDTSSYSLTPSQSAFLKDNVKDGKPMGKTKKAAYVGAPSTGDDPRVV